MFITSGYNKIISIYFTYLLLHWQNKITVNHNDHKFSISDMVFVKVRGSPKWPALVTALEKKNGSYQDNRVFQIYLVHHFHFGPKKPSRDLSVEFMDTLVYS